MVSRGSSQYFIEAATTAHRKNPLQIKGLIMREKNRGKHERKIDKNQRNSIETYVQNLGVKVKGFTL